MKKSHFYRLFTNTRVLASTCCACVFFIILFYLGDVFVIVFTQTCMHVFVDSKFKVHTLLRDVDQTYLLVNSTDKNSKAAVIGHAFGLKKTLPC